MSQQHFRAKITQNKDGLRLTRDNYAMIDKKCSTHGKCTNYFELYFGDSKREKFLEIYEDESALYYTDSFCEKRLEKILINFDLNMIYFRSLDHKEFDDSIFEFLKKNRNFKEIFVLNDVNEKAGYYIMILDEYCQIYLGTSSNIKRRILAHWSKRKQFDRLIFGSVENSKLSIDSFRALDTTRIYAYHSDDIYSEEDKFINEIDNRFLCNRTGGGIPEFGAVSILGTAKYRNFENTI